MATTHLEVTHARSPIAILDAGFTKAQLDEGAEAFAEWRREENALAEEKAMAEKKAVLSDLQAMAETLRTSAEPLITLTEMVEIVEIDKSVLSRFIRVHNLPRTYKRVPDTSGHRQRQMVFTEEQAKQVLQAYYGGT